MRYKCLTCGWTERTTGMVIKPITCGRAKWWQRPWHNVVEL